MSESGGVQFLGPSYSYICALMCKRGYVIYRKRQDGLIKELEKKQEAHRDTLGKLQSQLQQQQVKAAVKA